jgi:hypothetical protein
MKLHKYLLAFALVITGILSITPAAKADTNTTADSNWQYYSAFFNNPRRIMDGERYTYFFVYQENYSSNDDTLRFGLPCGTLFYYDKQNPDNGIQTLINKYNFSDLQMTLVDYNPRNKMLVVCYDDGGIDLVEETGTVTYFSDIKDSCESAQNKPTSISFDLYNDIWIGLHNGFIHINGTTKKVEETAKFGTAVNCITRVGDRVVASMATDIYDAPITTDICNVYNFTATGIASGRSPRSFMPLSDTAFAYIGTLSKANGGVFLCKYSDDNWTSTASINDAGSAGGFRAFDNGVYYGNPLENNVVYNRDGYLLFNNTYTYQIKLGLADEGGLNYKKRKTRWGNQNVLGSYDFESFWYYIAYGRFSMLKADDKYDSSTGWTAVTANLDPNGARAYRRIDIRYSPDYGMLTSNRGRDFNYTIEKANPVLLAGLKNGQWTDYASPFIVPTFTTDGTTYTGTYNKAAYPAYDPQDLTIDTSFPNYVFMGSFYDGIIAMSLDNPAGQVMHWGALEGRSANLPGFKETFPASSWRTVCPVRIAGVDNDGTVWALYNTQWHTTAAEIRTSLMYLTEDARRQAMENQDISLCGDWGELICNSENYAKDSALVLKHEKNKNKILIFTSDDERGILIYDHKGTLDDTSDDEQIYFTHFLNPYGGLRNFSEISNMAEDPITGDVYIAHNYGIDVIDPTAALVNAAMPAEPLSIIGPDNSRQNIGVAANITHVTLDEYNRIWVSTMTDGIYGINAEHTEVFAHYTTENSGIPDNYVYQSCWDPSSKRIYITTKKGLASVKPDEAGSDATDATLIAYPNMVDENYAGTITVYNVAGTSTIKVKDSKDNIVATLPAAVNNATYWNLLSDKGKNVPSGRYTIYDANGFYKGVEITVNR